MRFTLLALTFTAASLGTAQLVLPYSGTDATATVSSFQIIKSGTAGRANTLYITNAANASDALLVNTVGTGRAAYFSINNAANTANAVRGDSNGTGASIFGYMTGTGRAGTFRIANTSNNNYALYALTNGTGGTALRAEATAGLAGDFVGSIRVASGAPIGVNASSSADSGIAVYGDGLYAGVKGNSSNVGVDGVGQNYGVRGNSTGANVTVGVGGFAPTNSTNAYGVIGQCGGAMNFGVFASGNSGSNGTKSFRIDHPADPANKYLQHYSSEAPEPINFYSGNIVTDARGYAVVRLPEYFHSINRDFRYQLTVIGDFAQAIVAKEIENCQFTIRTDKPRVKVSWRVEATRNDPWVQTYGYKDVVEKTGREKGTYLAPQLYGMPAEMGTFTAVEQPAVAHKPKSP